MNSVKKWDERYNSDIYAYGKEPNDFLVEFAGKISPGKVLCLAEGEGRNAVYLSSLGHRVLAVDNSTVGLQKAQQLAKEKSLQIDTHLADLAHFDIKAETWEGIVSIFCHLPKAIRRQLHQKIVSGLKPGGVFILEAYTLLQLDYNTGGPKNIDLLYDIDSITRELNGLIFTHAIETVRDVFEGQFHRGKGAVVQIIANKPDEK